MFQTDFLVIGSGIAGLSFALKACAFGDVIVITKKENYESNTNYAQGGIAAVQDENDSFELHINDTLECGGGLCDLKAVEVLVKDGPQGVKELHNWGVRFTRDKEHPERFSLGREGGHSRRRIVRADDLTGREVERALLEELKKKPNVMVFENHIAIDLITKPAGSGQTRCVGAFAIDRQAGGIKAYISRVTLLASGGCGQVYLHTTNPAIATGDGIAMAYRAGARVANMEFIQFHPTALYRNEERAFLISEAVRGEGAILRRINGETFMERYHTMGCLAPRDIVARAIDHEMKTSGDKHVWLDCSPIGAEKIRERFPNITAECLARGLDITSEPIPVVPSAHYVCGGVITDIEGRTNIEALLAAGEVTCTGVHGANRLASNSLLEAVVFANSALKTAVELLEKLSHDEIDPRQYQYGKVCSTDYDGVFISHTREMIRLTMWDYVGIMRSNKRLAEARKWIKAFSEEIEASYLSSPLNPELVELRNIAQVAELIIRCALLRKESRGLHQNSDYPNRNDKKFLRPTVVERKN
ncbi:MAG: L-aspartate oxidase [Candidatus Glassbacteria bacterium RIFCSPLOWO2_12_FULL_58_11]|uniref:L-aspartate oxidase n=1 Tax=Candidatus Glassbacteria bacterium RIFCSPLOWO2_12_FULL_58_11 TaxID=1817867 RepID=A0A1F5YS08_9BACT|nr:MAG: L-aspartate oxidase [Candidatus Glassbacteria bacterium RIFCSPLOWO2_12_FULL_58_11]